MTGSQDWLNRIHRGDCLHLMRIMPKETVELIVTSPPYNLRLSTGNGMKPSASGKWPNAALAQGYPDHDDRMPHSKYIEWQRSCLHAMMDLLPDHGAIYYVQKWRVQAGRLQDRRDITDGFPVRQIVIWERSGGFNHNPGYHIPSYEVIYLIAKPGFRLNEYGRSLTDVWHIDQDRENDHPAPFPTELARRAIASTDAQVVLDPFCGSGTTPVAAIAEGRDWIGMEKSEEFCLKAEHRILHHGLWTPSNQLLMPIDD